MADTIDKPIEDRVEDVEESQEQRESKAFKDLQWDYKRAKDAKSTIDNLITEWNDSYYGTDMGSSNTGGSDIIMREIAKQIEMQKPNITEPFTSTSHPVRLSSTRGDGIARVMQKWANYQFTGEFDRITFISQLVDILLREGTVWTKTSWNFQEDVQFEHIPEITMPEILERASKGEEPYEITPNPQVEGKVESWDVTYKTTTDVQNAPDVEVCRNEHVFPDPAARTDEDMRFMIYKRYETLSDLRESGLYEEDDLDKLHTALGNEREDTNLGSVRDADAQDYGFDSGYQPKDIARRKIEIIEYWGYYDLDGDGIAEPIVATWAGKEKVNLRIEENPLPGKEIPFQRAVYSARPFSLWGNALAFFVGDNQRFKTGIFRAIDDNMSLSNNGQKFIQRGALDYVNMKRMRNGERHIIVNKDPKSSIIDGSFNQISNSVIQTMEMVSRETQEVAGVTPSSPALGGGGKEDKSDKQLTMSQQRMAGTVTNISGLVSKVIFNWVTMAETFLTNQQIEQLFTEEEQVNYYAFRGAQHTHINCKVGTDSSRSMKLHNLNMLLQQAKALGEQAPPGTVTALTAEMFELFDKYEEAEKIRTHVPQKTQAQALQDQVTQMEIQKLGLEMQKIESDIQVNQAEAENKRADSISTMKYKEAQSAEKWAKTEKHGVESAMKPAEALAQIEKLMSDIQNQNKPQGGQS